jgi:hypothetical protein
MQFSRFNADGKPLDAAFMKHCLPCHEQNNTRNLVFMQYATGWFILGWETCQSTVRRVTRN